MPKIKSEKLPANVNIKISSTSTNHLLPLQPAPVASADPIKSTNISSHLDEILIFPNQNLLNEEENLLINDPPYELTLSLKVLLSPARKNRKKKNNSDDKIPRPQNAWVLFRKDYEANQRLKFPDKTLKMKNVSTDAGEIWRNQPLKIKRYFEILSKLAHEQHKILYPDYKYTPKKKSIKETINTKKDLIFRNGSVKKSSTLETVTPDVENQGSSTITPVQTNIVPPQESPFHVTSSSESLNSIIINSPIPPSISFVSPMITQDDLSLYYSSVTSILTYSEETLENLSSSSYYNYQTISNDNLTSNLNNLNPLNSDFENYQRLINLTNMDSNNDSNFINDNMMNENSWQQFSSFDTQEQYHHIPVAISVAPIPLNNTFNTFLMDNTTTGNLSDLSSLFENNNNNNNNHHHHHFF